MNNTMLIID